MKRKIYSQSLLAQYKTYFIHNHFKFIHGHATESNDLNKTLTFEDKVLTLIGMNDDHLGVLHENTTGFYYVAHLKMVKELIIKSEQLN